MPLKLALCSSPPQPRAHTRPDRSQRTVSAIVDTFSCRELWSARSVLTSRCLRSLDQRDNERASGAQLAKVTLKVVRLTTHLLYEGRLHLQQPLQHNIGCSDVGRPGFESHRTEAL